MFFLNAQDRAGKAAPRHGRINRRANPPRNLLSVRTAAATGRRSGASWTDGVWHAASFAPERPSRCGHLDFVSRFRQSRTERDLSSQPWRECVRAFFTAAGNGPAVPRSVAAASGSERKTMKRHSKDRTAGAARVSPTPPVRPSYEAVSRRAREIWQARSCPQGCDEEIWFQAEREIADEMSRGMPPLEDRGIVTSEGGDDLSTRVDEAIAHHPAPERRSYPTSIS